MRPFVCLEDRGVWLAFASNELDTHFCTCAYKHGTRELSASISSSNMVALEYIATLEGDDASVQTPMSSPVSLASAHTKDTGKELVKISPYGSPTLCIHDLFLKL